MDDLMYRYLRKQYGVPQEWQGPIVDETQGPPSPPGAQNYMNPAGAPVSSFSQPMGAAQAESFPGPAFKPIGQDDDYQSQVKKIMQGDRLGRAMKAGEGSMSDALKLILTTGSAIRTGAPPVPQLRGDTAGEAMTDRTDRQLQAAIAGNKASNYYGITPEERAMNRSIRERSLGLGERNADLREQFGEAGLGLKEKQFEQAETRLGQAQTRLERVSEPTAIAIGDLVSTIEKIDKVRQQFAENPDVVGPIAGRWNQAVKKIGAGDPDADVFLANVDEIVFTNLYQLSGKQINEAERSDLKQTVIDAAKNGASFGALLDNYDNRVRIIISNKLKALKATGRKTEGLEGIVPGKGIRVRERATGQEGTLYDEPFDPAKYERIE